MITTYSTRFGGESISVSADWAQASCCIDGLESYQVAAVRHSGERALRLAVEACAEADGEDIEDEDTIAMIESAMDKMKAKDEDEEEEEDEEEDE